MRALLGPPPITSTEDGDAYARLEAELADAVRPTDAIEWIWLKDLVDLVWEARRLRRVKVATLAVSRAHSKRQLDDKRTGDSIAKLSDEELHAVQVTYTLKTLEEYEIVLPPEALRTLQAAAYRWLQSEADAEAASELAQLEIESDAYRACLQDLERFDRLITIADVRRDTILRDLYRRREMLARRGSASPSGPVIDVEFEG